MSDAPRGAMARSVTHRFLATSLAAPLATLAGCAGPDDARDPQETVAMAAEGLVRSTEPGQCHTVSAGGGWVNTPMPGWSGSLSVTLRGYPSTPATRPTIDTVVGLSSGAADAFSDLGPIVRFNEYGYIDARDGDHYAGAFPYTTGVGPFEFRMDISIPTHRYDVWVRHLDSPSKPFELLGEELAFRSEQSGVTALDNVGLFTDSAQGQLQTCSFVYTVTY